MSPAKLDNKSPHDDEVHEKQTRNSAVAAMSVEPAAEQTSPTRSVRRGLGRTSRRDRATTESNATASTASHVRSNRFSLSVPVQAPLNLGSPTRPTPPSIRDPITAVPSETATGSSDTNVLTAIATQERRVLELREELHKAELDLKALKEQWARHEASKKKADVRRSRKLDPLQTDVLQRVGARDNDADASSALIQETEKRKALMSGTRSLEGKNRTKFSGSRHARTLSLLSPARDDPPGCTRDGVVKQLPARKDSLSQAGKRNREILPPQLTRPAALSRASTTSDLTSEVATAVEPDQKLPDNTDVANTDRDALLRTGRKMALDIKDGLWTFFEDLRQATVGEEATQNSAIHSRNAVMKRQSTQTLNGKGAKKQPSRNSLRPSSRGSAASAETARRPSRSPKAGKQQEKSAALASTSATGLADPSFCAEHGILAQSAGPAIAAAKKPLASRGHKKDVSKTVSHSSSNEDPWDPWDEPSPKDSRSSSAASESHTAATTVSDSASPRPSEETGAKEKDTVAWPALNKLGPATLRRTASHLLSEWERQLTPGPGHEYRGEGQDYLGMGSEAQAIFAADRKRD